jgi:hypothetical protein
MNKGESDTVGEDGEEGEGDRHASKYKRIREVQTGTDLC